VIDITADKAAIDKAGIGAEFAPGSMASGSATELRNIKRARAAKCMELGGWIRGVDCCARCGGTRLDHLTGVTK